MPSELDALPLPRALHRARTRGGAPERSWTPVGTVDGGTLALVDSAGAVQPVDTGWFLDWWIGAEDRWHHPSVEAAVRQQPLGGTPVVETALRVPGGDVVHRAYGVQASIGSWRGAAVVVEIENLTAVPVALALAVRPLTLDGPGRVVRASIDGAVLAVDGRDAVLLSRPAARAVVGRSGRGEDAAAARVTAGQDRQAPVGTEDRDGRAEVAAVVPLPHTATVRALLPGPGWPRPAGTDGVAGPVSWDAPSAAAVVAGWSAHRDAAARVVLPEAGWADGLAWADRMLVLSGPDEVGACLDRRRVRPAGPAAAVRAATVSEALARLGGAEPLEPVARALAAAQRLGGEARLGDRTDGTVALLHAAAGVLGGPRAGARAEELVAPVAVAIRRVRKGKGLDGALSRSAVRALRHVAPGLVAVGQPEVAADARLVAVALGGDEAPGDVAPGDVADDGSALGAALAARSVVAAGGADAVAALRPMWDGHETAGRPDGPDGVLGFDVAELAARTCALLDLVVRDGDAGPALLAGCPSAWRGAGIEAHGVRGAWGSVSYAVRWHGGRPALLWEVEPAAGLDPGLVPTVTAPGLDAAWVGTGWTGEALLGEPAPGPVDPTGSVGPADGMSFS
jgi:hypothetical protein